MLHFDDSFYETHAITRPEVRREHLISKMSSCDGCNGSCCSESSNSMQISPLETIDLSIFLKRNNLITESLIQKLKMCIEQYRLDQEILVKRNVTFRRTYCCPFYTEGERGCSISRKHKPYGCLAFNRNTDGQCHSDQEILLHLDNKYHDDEKKARSLLPFQKKSTPLALLSLLPN